MSAPVVIDVTRLLGRMMDGRLPTGVDKVSLAYVNHYGPRARALARLGRRSGVFSPAVSQRVFDLLTQWPGRAQARARWLAVQGALSCIGRGDAQQRFMFNTGHSGLEHVSAAAVVRRHRVRPVYMLHDLIPLRHPEFCRPGEAERHERRVRNMLRLGAGIIANSQATLDDLRDYGREIGVALPPTVVAPLAPSQAAPASRVPGVAATGAAEPYFVVVSTIEPRKNHLMLLQAWQRLVRQHGDAAPRLVLIGQQGWEAENVEDLLERGQGLRSHVTVLGKCSDAELVHRLQGARALLFPSFAEGFGLPVVEALQAGVPVIASDLPVLREIAGDVPDFLDPLDTPAWMARVLDYAQPHSAARAAQLQRLQGFEARSWAQHFDCVDGFLHSLHHGPHARH